MIGRILGTAKYQNGEIERIKGLPISDESKTIAINNLINSCTTFKMLQRVLAMSIGGVYLTNFVIGQLLFSLGSINDESSRLWHAFIINGDNTLATPFAVVVALYIGGGTLNSLKGIIPKSAK